MAVPPEAGAWPLVVRLAVVRRGSARAEWVARWTARRSGRPMRSGRRLRRRRPRLPRQRRLRLPSSRSSSSQGAGRLLGLQFGRLPGGGRCGGMRQHRPALPVQARPATRGRPAARARSCGRPSARWPRPRPPPLVPPRPRAPARTVQPGCSMAIPAGRLRAHVGTPKPLQAPGPPAGERLRIRCRTGPGASTGRTWGRGRRRVYQASARIVPCSVGPRHRAGTVGRAWPRGRYPPRSCSESTWSAPADRASRHSVAHSPAGWASPTSSSTRCRGRPTGWRHRPRCSASG